MKKLFLIVSLLVSLVGYSQYPPNGTKNQWKQGIALGSKNRGDFNSNDSLILTIDKNGKLLWRGNGANATWFTALDSTSAGSGTVTSISTNNGTGINGGTITTSGTLSIDTTNISTRLFRIKGTDSLAGLIALKLSIADTANMLSAYQRLLANYSTTYALSNDVKDSIQARLRISDTASMLANYTKLSGDSSLNNSIAIFDGTTGKKIKDTKLIVTDYADNDAEVTYISSTVSSFGNGREITIEGADATTGVGGPVFLVAGLPANGDGSNAGIYATRGIGTNKNGGSLLFDFGAGTGTGTNGGVTLSLNSGTGFRRGIIKLDNLTPFPAADKIWQMPDASGTIALTSNLSSKLNISDTAAMLSGYVLNNRFLDTASALQSRIQTKQPLLTNPVTGTGVNNYVAYWNGTNTQTGSGKFTWNDASSILSIWAGSTSQQVSIGSINSGTGNRNIQIVGGTPYIFMENSGTANMTIGSGVANLLNYNHIITRGIPFVINYSSTVGSDGSQVARFDNNGTTSSAFIKSGGTSSQFLKADGSVDNNTYATTSSLATKLNISDTAAMLTYYLRNRTGLSDSYAIGNGSMLNATSGTRNIGLGSFSLQNNTDGGNNVAIGYEALKNGSSISNNTAIGYAAGSAAIPTDVENSVYLGYNSTPQAFSSVTNEIVIGASTTGNGSNTVTIGNSSITNNYFTGNVRGGAFIKSGGTSSQFLKADGSVDGNTYATTSSLGSYAYRSSGLAELSGATFTGALNGTSLSMSGGGSVLGNLAQGAASTTYNILANNPSAANSVIALSQTSSSSEIQSNGQDLYFNLLGTGSIIFRRGASFTESGRFASDGTFLINTTTTDGTNKLIVNGGVKGTSYSVNGNGTISNSGFWGTLTTAGTGSFADWAVLDNGSNRILHVPTGTKNLVLGGNITIDGTTQATGAATFSSSVTASGNGSAFGTTANSTIPVTIQANSSNQAIKFLNSSGGQGSISFTGSSTSMSYFFNTNSNSNVLQIAENGAVTLSSLGTGTVYSNSGTLTNVNPSDSTIKNTINSHKYGLAEILKLKPKSFYYNSDSTKSSLKYGFIAQEVQKIMPDLVRKINPSEKSSKLGIETDGIYVTLVNAIKEQQAQIELLKAQLEALKPKQ